MFTRNWWKYAIGVVQRSFPIYNEKKKGTKLEDIDGHVYIDMVREMSAGIFGHSHPLIRQAVVIAFHNTGIRLRANSVCETHFALELKKRFPSFEI